jgi:hypothetical protein
MKAAAICSIESGLRFSAKFLEARLMAEFLKAIQLRNPRAIYRDEEGFVVEQDDPRGRKYSSTIPIFIVDYVYAHLKGKRVIVEDAEELLAPKAAEFSLPYRGGYKLQFYAQDVLLVLVALDKAKLIKDGRRYLYDIRST